MSISEKAQHPLSLLQPGMSSLLLRCRLYRIFCQVLVGQVHAKKEETAFPERQVEFISDGEDVVKRDDVLHLPV